ncbi:hypothetical protein IWQ57_003692 [Coemansia nantahalensis]|uniref:Uncharacterized protein n=1 Tax=Coemansia nantahalensis TaxID=2789366 RepID=A0ACC1JVF6_9FUNG|nr:hypothetical protein IWQ57_003692 [Coemansia nantahalensis]
MSSETYKVAAVERYTGNAEDYVLAELPRPQLTTATQVEIEVHAASLNPIDYKRAKGMLSALQPDTFPLKVGYDVAGVVTKAGDGVTRFKPGDRVYGRVGERDGGTIAEWMVAEESALGHIPGSVSFATAAAVPLAGLTALQALDAAGLQRGQSLFVSAGMGGVGMFAVALAKHHFGAAVIATTVSAAKREAAEEMGATKVIDYKTEDYTLVLKDLVDVGFDTTGDSNIYKAIKQGGQAVSVAMMPDGATLDGFRNPDAPLSLFGSAKLAAIKCVADGVQWFTTRRLRAKGIGYRYLLMKPDGKALEAVFNPLLESGTLVPAISSEHPFTEAGVRAAFKESIAGHATGKIVVKVRD